MAGNIVEYTVSELAFALKRTIEDAYGLVRVRGELSGLKRAASGHCYFALKDDKAVLDAVLWRGSAGRLAFQPEDGLEVVCTGRLTTYPGRSKYQLVVEEMAPAGIGALMALLEERKRRLAAEGLFDAARKRPLPFLPETVGVVTSPTGAVIRDILHRLADRFPRRVILWPVLVQGEGAAEQVAAAIDGLGALAAAGEPPRPDVLIVARGGGSIEDLWAFNEEVVVRAVARSPVPVISAVGHETDTTLIDLVADRRAPTPTAAAEMAVPVRRELLQRLDGLAERLVRGVEKLLDGLGERVAGLARGLPEPRLLATHAAQRLDDAGERLVQAARGRIELLTARLERAHGAMRPPASLLREATLTLDHRAQRLGDLARDRLRAVGRDLAAAGARLLAVPRDARLLAAGQRLAAGAERLDRAAGRRLDDTATNLGRLARLLDGLSPTHVLERGYTIVRATAGAVLPTLAAAAPHRELTIQFADGRLAVQQPGGAARGQAAHGRRGPEQGELL